MKSIWPVDVVALSPLSCGTVVWRALGVLRVTVFAKATFALNAGRDATLRAPEPAVGESRFLGEDPARSLERAGDAAPYLPTAGVVLTGHAYAPRGTPVTALSARLTLLRDGVLLDKTIQVLGDAVAGSDTPAPFLTLPLVYERAYGGPDVSSHR